MVKTVIVLLLCVLLVTFLRIQSHGKLSPRKPTIWQTCLELFSNHLQQIKVFNPKTGGLSMTHHDTGPLPEN